MRDKPYSQKEIIELASRTAIKAFEEQRREYRHLIRRRYTDNTKKILKRYAELKLHIDEAIDNTIECMPTDLQLVLGEVFDSKGMIRVMAIAQNKERTQVMLAHIDNMLSIYQKQCEAHNSPCFETVWRFYLNGETLNEVSEAMHVNKRTIQRYAKKGIEDMSILLWGVPAISV